MANTQVLIQEEGRGYIGHALDYDAAGKGFLAVANADPNNANVVLVKVYRAERGQPFNPTPIDTMIPNWKVDAVQLTHTGNNLVVSATTHEPGEAPRTTMVETRVVAGVWTTSPSFEAERGGPGGFTGSEPGGGGEAEVDYARIETIVNFVVSRIVGATQTDSLVKQITTGSGQSLRQALRDDLGKDADLGLLTGSDQKASTYKAALFDFTKNASANPWANVLGAQDAWGQQRQAELRRIIREEVEAVIGNQAKAAAPKKADSPPIGSGPKE